MIIAPGAVTTLLQTTTNATGQAIAYPQGGNPEITAFIAELAPGQRTVWHQHPFPLLGYVLSGALTVYQASGDKRTVHTGEVSLEAVDSVHYGINEGTVTLKMIVFVVGQKDIPFTLEAKEPR